MKKLLLIITILCAASYSFAADGILKTLGDVKTLSADFVQTNFYKDAQTGKTVEDTYAGRVSVIMKNKAIFEYIEPYESWYLFSDGAMQTYDSITNQLVKYKKNSVADNIFLEVLTDFSAIEANFDVKTASDNLLSLTPKTDIGVKYLEVKVDVDNKISSMKTEDALGNITELKFANVKINGKIPDKAFVRKLPAGVTVIEQ